MFFAICNLVFGLYSVWFGMVMKATGDNPAFSAFLFKVIPTIFGFITLLEGLKQMGWI